MKIYNEILTRFNDTTGKWETISEDSYNYDGIVDLTQGISAVPGTGGGLPPNSTAVNAGDTITDTIKTTAGYFTGGDGTLSGTDVHTGSLSLSNRKYYVNVTQKHPLSASSEVQFSLTFGHIAGSGSDQYGDSLNDPKTIRGETQAIYRQLSSLLQHENEITGGFKIAANGSSLPAGITANSRDEYIYALIGKKARFKDRLNKKNWTLTLSGSDTYGVGKTLYLTDDSKTVAPVGTPGGPRYNIVSGTLGIASTPASTKTYGWFYPEMGCMVFSGAQLSASIPGVGAYYVSSSAHPQSIGGAEPQGLATGSFFTGSRVAGRTTGADVCWGQVLTGSTATVNQSDNALHPLATRLDVTGSLSAGDYIMVVSGSAIHGGTAAIQSAAGKQIVRVLGVNVNSGDGAVAGQHNQYVTMSHALTASIGTADEVSKLIVHKLVDRELLAPSASFNLHTYNAVGSGSGFAPILWAKGNGFNAVQFANCLRHNGSKTTLQMRSEEDATQENYFCRIRANEYNFSSNPTFVSGSKNKLSQSDMWGNPTVFITEVGLYNSAGQLLAIARTSKPIKKNFATESTIKVKLTY